MGDPLASIRAELDEITAQGLLRTRPLIDSPDGRLIVWRAGQRRLKLVNWASNDYLGMAGELVVANGARKAIRSWGAGSGAARLLGGGLALHRRLEQRLARFLGAADCLLTTTGFQANLAALGALAGDPEDVLILDRRCHASTYDGARLAAGTLLRFQHNDLIDLERNLARAAHARRRIVCVESIYSMDGDEAPLEEIRALCDRHDALLLVDEAHAVGVFGPGGRGRCAETAVRADVRVGTCSKALGSQGGFIAADAAVVELCVNRGRAFIFSTAPVPAATGAALAALELLERHPERATALLAQAAALRAALTAQGWDIPPGRSPIIPLVVGDEAAALDLATRLRGLGHHAPAIRPPTVAAGSCRVRLTLTAAHRPVDQRRLLAALAAVRAAPVPSQAQG